MLKRPMIADVMEEANKVASVLKKKFKQPQRHCSLCSCTTLDRSCHHHSDCCFGKACHMVDVEEENLKGGKE